MNCFSITYFNSSNSRQYLPRKGTETLDSNSEFYKERAKIPDNIYPARGRKLNLLAFERQVVFLIPDNIYPARGRKQNLLSPLGLTAGVISFPTIFTPQGDGNLWYMGQEPEIKFLNSRQYLPRKGTETQNHQ